jgi:poly-gamma-glutamate system protein
MLRKKEFPKENPHTYETATLILCGLSIIFFVLLKLLPQSQMDHLQREMTFASEIMAEATETLRECRLERGLLIERNTDINGTGLIGLEHSKITTSIGSLGSKRTSTNPNFAGLVVRLLKECGVQRGNVVAVGASGSFPSLIIAVLSAAKALGVQPLWIPSLGASQWGANHPEFHWLHMWQCLEKKGLFDRPPLALSLGGEGDTGEDMDEAGRQLLWEDIRGNGLPFLNVPGLIQNVRARMALFETAAGGKEIKAFINIGGSWSNMGTDSMVLHVTPGINRIEKFPPLERRGVIYAMAAKGIPVIHLLYVRGLSQRYGLPWDPSPLPGPGEGALYQISGKGQSTFFWGALLYLFLFLCVLFFMRRQGSFMRRE